MPRLTCVQPIFTAITACFEFQRRERERSVAGAVATWFPVTFRPGELPGTEAYAVTPSPGSEDGPTAAAARPRRVRGRTRVTGNQELVKERSGRRDRDRAVAPGSAAPATGGARLGIAALRRRREMKQSDRSHGVHRRQTPGNSAPTLPRQRRRGDWRSGSRWCHRRSPASRGSFRRAWTS